MESRKYRKPLFYLLISLFLIWIILDPEVTLSPKDAVIIILFIAVMHSWIEKKYLLTKVTSQFETQSDFMKDFFTHCPDLIYRKDSVLNYVGCNPIMQEMLDADQAENVCEKTDYDFFSKETANVIRTYDKIVMETGKIVSYKIEKTLSNGKVKIYDALIAPVKHDDEIVGVIGIMRDITHTEELKQKIMIQNAQLNAMLDNIPFILYLKDINGRCVAVNKNLEEMLGIPREQLIGKSSKDFYLPEYADYIDRQDATLMKEKQTICHEKRGMAFHSTNQEWYRIIKSPIFDRNKNVIGIIVVIENINFIKEQEAHKETFVATLTHDLKTPTTAQTRAMKLLLDGILGPLNDDQKEMIEQTLNSNVYMSELISTILATYKSDSGETVLNLEEFDFCELVNMTCKEISNLAYEKGQKIVLETKVHNNLIFADKLQIKRVIVNLVSNAITYGFNHSEITLAIEDADDQIVFNVQNQSSYITEEKLTEVFEKYKTAPAAKFNKSSTGLGLYLSKQIINSHSGEIHAFSDEKEQICTFGFSIPKAPKVSAEPQEKVR